MLEIGTRIELGPKVEDVITTDSTPLLELKTVHSWPCQLSRSSGLLFGGVSLSPVSFPFTTTLYPKPLPSCHTMLYILKIRLIWSLNNVIDELVLSDNMTDKTSLPFPLEPS